MHSKSVHYFSVAQSPACPRWTIPSERINLLFENLTSNHAKFDRMFLNLNFPVELLETCQATKASIVP
jgi:hypothetical protein